MSASLLGSVGVCNKRVKANKGQKSQATIYLTKEYQEVILFLLKEIMRMQFDLT